MSSTVEIGQWGEEQACKFLQRKGYSVLERNYYTRAGEIDIIASRDDQLSFIEVKTRTKKPESGSAERATNRAQKFKKMMIIAKEFCSKTSENTDGFIFCFEHVSVYVNKKNKKVSFKKYQLID